jgi:hypothetical protein
MEKIMTKKLEINLNCFMVDYLLVTKMWCNNGRKLMGERYSSQGYWSSTAMRIVMDDGYLCIDEYCSF